MIADCRAGRFLAHSITDLEHLVSCLLRSPDDRPKEPKNRLHEGRPGPRRFHGCATHWPNYWPTRKHPGLTTLPPEEREWMDAPSVGQGMAKTVKIEKGGQFSGRPFVISCTLGARRSLLLENQPVSPGPFQR